MLCQFSFKNFKSYKNETVFDFQAASLSEHLNSLITQEKASELLPVSVIYGPNGGGKTNLICALACLITLVVSPIHELGKNRNKMIFQQKVPCEPFLFDRASINEPTEFNIFFRTNGNEYRYYIALTKDEITSESLYRKTIGGKKTAMIFEREGLKIELGASLSKGSINTKVNPKMPYISFLAINYNLPKIAEVQKWFESCIIRNYANPQIEKSMIISEDKKFKQHLLNTMNDMGIDISDYYLDKENNDMLLVRNINKENYPISFSSESDGTKKLFASLPILMIAIAEGRLVIIDELDAKLHPKLLRYIISLFTNRGINKNGAQLIFTSHDMSTMKNDVFRRDEIWFAALDNEHSSELYSLYEIRKEDGNRINHTAAYDKQYLEGRYGADPYLRTMLDWEELS
ncbi:MAG: AAA family ATPase [Clostridia bacterium]|nr:AAA family ATPase [Clostridia bacterium]